MSTRDRGRESRSRDVRFSGLMVVVSLAILAAVGSSALRAAPPDARGGGYNPASDPAPEQEES